MWCLNISYTLILTIWAKVRQIVLDVLHKNEAKHEDMLDIMRIQQSYLEPHLNVTRLSGGDQLTCKRQRCVKRHTMDGDTAIERLDYLEPKTGMPCKLFKW